MAAIFLIATNISILGRDTTIPQDGSDENRSNLLVIDQQQLRMEVDVINCRWSAHLKGTKVAIHNAYFLPGNDPSGWEVISSINNDDKNGLGNFVTVTLRGKKPGELDFNYQVSVSKSGNDIIISLGRSNNTGHSVDVTDMDCFVSDNVSLEGTHDQWITFGAHSIFHDYYDLIPVNTLKEPGMYESSHLVRNQKTGNVVLMGHLTANKGHSRFEVQWALYYCGGNGEYGGVDFPAECYLPVKVKWGNGKVVDFSNPVAIKFERDRVLGLIKGKEDKVFRGWVDWSETWDVWPGQYDPFMSALETWHAGSAPYRELPAEKIAPRMRSKSCMTRYDFNYGSMQLCRVDEDADGWPSGDAYGDNVQLNKNGGRAFLSECVPGATSRFYYNTRVFWNDPDGHHVYSFFGHKIDYARAKVMTCFKVMATSCLNPAESFDIPYPDDRIELLKRAAPPTTDPAYPVDLFLRKPAGIWNMPVERPFGNWDILCVINYKEGNPDFSATLDAKTDLRLDPQKEYLVYEFFSKKFMGTFKGTFTSRAIKGPDCDVYSIVEKQNHPVLLSTSRHIRQMAFDIKNMIYEPKSKALIGLSRAVGGDPYQLRIYVPEGYGLDRVEVPAGLKVETTMDDRLLMINFTTENEDDVQWKVYFK